MIPTNPFSTRFTRPGAIDFLAPPGALAAMTARIADGGRWAIVGPHGTGKTTLLFALRQRLFARGIATETLSIHDDGRRRRRLRTKGSSPEVFFIDGYEQLSWLERRWLTRGVPFRRARSLVVTSHRPCLTPLLTTEVTVDLAETIVSGLLGDAPSSPVTVEDVRPALRACDGNMREALFRLYDEHERRRSSTVEIGPYPRRDVVVPIQRPP